jgi:hypothetical protein
MQFGFGAGTLIACRTDVTPSTPREFAGFQDISIDFSGAIKEGYGTYQWPLAVARGKGKIACKAKALLINGQIYQDLFFGSAATATVGQLKESYKEGPTAIPGTPFQITVVNGATFVDDLGVINSATGAPMTNIGSGTPAAGQYKFSAAGVYTFSSADNVSGISVQISYTYTYATSGTKLVIANPQMGINPVFQAVFNLPYTAPGVGVVNFLCKLNACVSEKLGLASKLDDFMMPEFDFEAFADASNNLMTLSVV